MTTLFWRRLHLVLAWTAGAVLLISSLSGLVLSYDALQDAVKPYRAKDFDQLTLAEVLPELKKQYPEIFELRVDENGFVTLEGTDTEGENISAIVDPHTGKTLSQPLEKSHLMNWMISFHRSLMLKNPGRFMVGIFSVLFVLVSLTGFGLLIKRQKGWRRIFASLKGESGDTHLHVLWGRILLLPLLFTALTATLLFLIRFDLIPEHPERELTEQYQTSPTEQLADFPVFKQIKLQEVSSIDFPFMEGDPEDPFVLKLKDRTLEVNQIDGKVESAVQLPSRSRWEALALELHSGRGSIVLSVILGIASLGVLLFVYSGVRITLRRRKNKIKNIFRPTEAEVVILVGSENGTTIGFAIKFQRQLQALGIKTYLAELNALTEFPAMRRLVIFTATSGLGDAPSNATGAGALIKKTLFHPEISVDIVGFGSKAYPDFCGFAEKLKTAFIEKNLDPHLFKIDDKDMTAFMHWLEEWNAETGYKLPLSPVLYQLDPPGLSDFQVKEIVCYQEEETFLKVLLHPLSRQKFRSGDLLAIYPEEDHRERYYSVAKIGAEIQLIVKYYAEGLGSEFFRKMKDGKSVKARIVPNPQFHIPKAAKEVAMISNGTGIAPFLGMIDENRGKKKFHLYAGFKWETAMTKSYREFSDVAKSAGKLEESHFIYSREENGGYVMNLVQRDANLFVKILRDGGYIMICGSLQMEKDVERVLEEICLKAGLSYLDYKAQILSDCY